MSLSFIRPHSTRTTMYILSLTVPFLLSLLAIAWLGHSHLVSGNTSRFFLVCAVAWVISSLAITGTFIALEQQQRSSPLTNTLIVFISNAIALVGPTAVLRASAIKGRSNAFLAALTLPLSFVSGFVFGVCSVALSCSLLKSC